MPKLLLFSLNKMVDIIFLLFIFIFSSYWKRNKSVNKADFTLIHFTDPFADMKGNEFSKHKRNDNNKRVIAWRDNDYRTYYSVFTGNYHCYWRGAGVTTTFEMYLRQRKFND